MKQIAVCFVFVMIIAMIFGLSLRLLVSNDPLPEKVQIELVFQDAEFFKIGKYGDTIILETCERRVGAKGKKD